MSDREMYFPPISGYPKQSNTAMSVDAVEAWLDQFPQKRAENKPNGGIIRSVADTSELYLREMSVSERKVARAKAQREHRQALKNLDKQREHDNKKIAKQLVKWRKEGKPQPTAEELAAKKEAYRIRRNEANRKKSLALNAGKVKNEMSTAKGQEVLDKLKSDGVYAMSDWTLNRKYLIFIMSEVRRLGYQVGNIKSGRRITHYTMGKQ